MIDVIVPTIQGREKSLTRCVESYYGDTNVIVVPDSRTCGWGWKQGLIASRAPYVLLACDDQECIGPDWMDICMETADEGYLACPRVWFADGTVESMGGDMAMFNHTSLAPKKDRTPVDYTTIPFLSREQADAIGMLEIHYCSDVWVSYRGRQLGYETVLRHGYDVIHHREDVGRGAGMTVLERDAMDERTMREEVARCESLSPAA